jgi:hypothetical protein
MQKITREVETALTALRRLALRFWRRHLVQEFLIWLRAKYGLARTDHTNLANWNETLHKYGWSSDGKLNYKSRLEAWLIVGSRDIVPGVDALERGLAADMRDKGSLDESWWEWPDGSRPFHWRWPKWYQATIRDGLKMHFIGQQPRYRTAQRDHKNPEEKK